MGIYQDLVSFLDDFKKYRDLCNKERKSNEEYKCEETLRENLTQRLGQIEPLINNLPNIPVYIYVPAVGMNYNVLNEALSTITKMQGMFLEGAIQALNKAVGAARNYDEQQLKALVRPSSEVFLAYSFRPENEKLVHLVRDLLVAIGFEILEGEEPKPISVSDKVKQKITSSDCLVALMTKDKQDDKGEWLPSDWVREEAVFALAQKKHVIRILEEGVSKEGKIFGDQEFIPIEKDNPARGIVHLARMIQSVKKG